MYCRMNYRASTKVGLHHRKLTHDHSTQIKCRTWAERGRLGTWVRSAAGQFVWCAYGKCISSHTSSMFDLIGMLDHSRISLTISNRPRNSRPFPGRRGLFPEHTRPSLIISWIFQTNSRPLGPFPGHLGLIFWQFWTIPWQFPGISGRFPPIAWLSP